jgi:hypothetical protein
MLVGSGRFSSDSHFALTLQAITHSGTFNPFAKFRLSTNAASVIGILMIALRSATSAPIF